ncbi:MAG: PAS domain-containing protein [Paramuribaculum sp.]|nr:PAS domain-containing protein [Paramuribaculum sp.]
MRAGWIFGLLAVWIVGIGILLLFVPEIIARGTRVFYSVAAIAVIVPLFLLWRLFVSLLRPISAVNNGMDLVRAQDFSSRLVPVGQKDADRLVGMFNKIIERLKEERLHNIEQNHFLQLLIQASPMGIAIQDYDGRITMANPSMLRFLDISDTNINGKSFTAIAGSTAKAIAETPDGTTRSVRLGDTMVIRIARLGFMENGFRRPYVLVESLTDEVLKAEKAAYGKVIRLIAHEVNNTMAGVNSMLETLAIVLADDTELAEAIDSCHDRCGSMSRFITSYADVVRIPEANLVPVELNARLKSMMPFLEGLAGNSIKLTLEESEKPAPARADTVLLEQVLVNIVKNSRESIGDRPGHINIKVGDNPSSLEIADNGAGISDDTASHLFSPFFSTKQGGQGLGLMMISDILRQHGCKFSLRTDSGGAQTALTRFKIIFP